ncbi:MAG: MFS transporter [Paludibacter sp.]
MKSNSVKVILPVVFSFFVMGFCDIVGISSDYARDAFGWSNTVTGFVPSMVFIWFLFLSIPVGIIMNKWGRKNTVLFSMLVTIIGMFIPLIHYNSASTILAYALLGIGNAILQVSLNPLLSNVVTNKKLLTSSLTIGQVVKALSSLIGPVIVLYSIRIFGNSDNYYWYYSFPVLGAITLLTGLWLLLIKIPKEENEMEAPTFKETFSLLKEKKLMLLFLGIVFVVGVDVAINFISSKIMITRYNWDKSDAGIAPQVYFFSRTVGALLGAFLMAKITEIKYFRFNILLAIIAILVLAFSKNETINLVSIGAIGFLASCVFSIIYSMAIQLYPEKVNQISGLMITGVAGGGVVTPIIGFVTDKFSITAGVWVILVCILYLTYCAFGVKTAEK